MVDFDNLHLLQKFKRHHEYNKSEEIFQELRGDFYYSKNQFKQDGEKNKGLYCVDEKQTVMILVNDQRQIERRLIPNFELLNRVNAPSEFNLDQIWMSHDAKKLILKLQEQNCLKINVYHIKDIFEAFSGYTSTQGSCTNPNPIASFVVGLNSQISEVKLTHNMQKIIILGDLYSIGASDFLERSDSLKGVFIIDVSSQQQDLINKDTTLITFLTSTQESIQQQITSKEMEDQSQIHYNGCFSFFQLEQEDSLKSENQISFGRDHIIISKGQLDSKDHLIINIDESQNYTITKLITTSSKETIANDGYIVEIERDGQWISKLSVCQYNKDTQKLEKLYSLSPLVYEIEEIQVIKVDNKSLTYLAQIINKNQVIPIDAVTPSVYQPPSNEDINSSQIIAKESLKHQTSRYKSYILQQSSDTKIHIYEDCPIELDIKQILWNQYFTYKLLVCCGDGTFYTTSFYERTSIFQIWDKELDQGYQFIDFEEDARFAFDDIVEHKVKYIYNTDIVTFAMVRDIAVEGNESEKERWLGFYQNSKFHKSMKFENYTLKQFKYSSQDKNGAIQAYTITENEILLLDFNEMFELTNTESTFKLEDGLTIKKITFFQQDRQYKAIRDQNMKFGLLDSQDMYMTAYLDSNDVCDRPQKISYSQNSICKITEYGILQLSQENHYVRTYFQISDRTSKVLLRESQRFILKNAIAFSDSLVIQSKDNRLFFFDNRNIQEIVLPEAMQGKPFEMKGKTQIRDQSVILSFYNCEKCDKDSEVIEKCSCYTNSRQTVVEICLIGCNEFTTSFFTHRTISFMSSLGYFKYTDSKNNRYDIYDTLTNQKISYVEAAFCQAEAKLWTLLQDVSTREVVNLIKRGPQQIKQLLKNYGIGNLMNMIMLNEQALEALKEELLLFPKEEIPQIFQSYGFRSNVLGTAIQQNMVRCVKVMLDIFIEFQDHYVLGRIIDTNFNELMSKNYDMKRFLEKDILFTKLQDMDTLPEFVQHNEVIYYAEQSYRENQLTYISTLRPDQYAPNYQVGDQSRNEKVYPCEYTLVCMQDSMFSTYKFLGGLSEHKNLEIFEHEGIHDVIDYIWSQSPFEYFQKQEKIYLFYLLLLLIDVFYSLFWKIQDDDGVIDDSRSGWVMTPIKIVITLINTSYLYKCMFNFYVVFHNNRCSADLVSRRGYLQDKWNDLSLILSLSVYVIIFVDYRQDVYEGLRLAQIYMLILGFLRVNYYLRIHDGFGFMISMFTEVFVDLKYFVIFFIMIIIEFALLFLLVFKGSSMEEYQGLSTFGGYMMMAFRLSTGDFALDSYKDQPSMFILITWGIWLVSVFALNMIFLNFIIAVISETFEKVMQKQAAQQYKLKVEMLCTILAHGLVKTPESLIIQKPIQVSNEEESQQGFIRNLKHSLKYNNQKTYNEVSFKLEEFNENINQDVSDVQKTYDQERKEIIEDIDEIQRLLTQI
eukprot:403356490